MSIATSIDWVCPRTVLVITSGIIGAMLSGLLYDWIGVRDWETRGLATGIASHGIGTATTAVNRPLRPIARPVNAPAVSFTRRLA